MITFVPERGQILLCDFDMANVPPEMRKKRRVVVLSPRSYNRARRCIAVPFSATKPDVKTAAHIAFAGDVYLSLSVPTWAICDAVSHVSWARLDRVKIGRSYHSESITAVDMARLEQGLQHALGMSR